MASETIFNYLQKYLEDKLLVDKAGNEYVRGPPAENKISVVNVRTGACFHYINLSQLTGLEISGLIDKERRGKILEKWVIWPPK